MTALGLVSSATAAPVFYSDDDPGAGPGDPRPNSDAAALAFVTALVADGVDLGDAGFIDFETVPLEFFSGTRTIGTGVTATISGDVDTSSPAGSGIRDNDQDLDIGYNTTPAGERFLRVSPNFGFDSIVLEIAFDDPIEAFGAFITDIEGGASGEVEVTFDDGSLQTFPLITSETAGVQFFGFSDFGKLVSSVRFTETPTGGTSRDIWAIDDIGYVPARVPAPGGLALAGLGLIILGLRRRSA